MGAVMSEVVYRSQVRIERVRGPIRKAYLPAETGPVVFGVHGFFADRCPVYRTLKPAIAITTELIFEALTA